MTTITICNGCNSRIADADPLAARRVPLPDTNDAAGTTPVPLVDWCGDCVAIIRAELPNLAAEARRARHAAATRSPGSGTPVRSRALRLWEGGAPRVVGGKPNQA